MKIDRFFFRRYLIESSLFFVMSVTLLSMIFYIVSLDAILNIDNVKMNNFLLTLFGVSFSTIVPLWVYRNSKNPSCDPITKLFIDVSKDILKHKKTKEILYDEKNKKFCEINKDSIEEIMRNNVDNFRGYSSDNEIEMKNYNVNFKKYSFCLNSWELYKEYPENVNHMKNFLFLHFTRDKNENN